MIVVKFKKDGQEFLLPGYKDEDAYIKQILAALTGIPLPLLIGADLTDTESEMIEEAAFALRGIDMWARNEPAQPKPKLEVV